MPLLFLPSLAPFLKAATSYLLTPMRIPYPPAISVAPYLAQCLAPVPGVLPCALCPTPLALFPVPSGCPLTGLLDPLAVLDVGL